MTSPGESVRGVGTERGGTLPSSGAGGDALRGGPWRHADAAVEPVQTLNASEAEGRTTNATSARTRWARTRAHTRGLPPSLVRLFFVKLGKIVCELIFIMNDTKTMFGMRIVL